MHAKCLCDMFFLVVLMVQVSLFMVHNKNYKRFVVMYFFPCLGNFGFTKGQSRTMVVVLAPGMVGGFQALY